MQFLIMCAIFQNILSGGKWQNIECQIIDLRAIQNKWSITFFF